MKILPTTTEPFSEVVVRRHKPPEADYEGAYRTYRPCLRWEFGFTCAFCLLHESDFVDFGITRSGLFWIEHIITQSSEEGKPVKNVYTNVVYSCGWCNRARDSYPPVSEDGEVLLDPTKEQWNRLFHIVDDEMQLVDGNKNAAYTYNTYQLGDPYKTGLRRKRRERLEKALLHQQVVPGLIQRLQAVLDTKEVTPDDKVAMLKQLEVNTSILNDVQFVFRRYTACPQDADDSCRCKQENLLSLPNVVETQLLEISLEDVFSIDLSCGERSD